MKKIYEKKTIQEILDETIELVYDEKAKENVDKANDQDIAIFIGNTRGGKSTIVNFLIGNKLIAEKEIRGPNYKITKEKPDEDPAIGLEPLSKTTLPTVWGDEMINKKILEKIIDAPGFDDNRGPSQDIANAFYIKELISNAKSVKIILISSIRDLEPYEAGSNIKPFTDFIKTVYRILPNIISSKALKESISIIFSKDKDNVSKKDICDALEDKILKSEIAIDKSLIEHFVKHPENIGFLKMPTHEGIINDEDIGGSIVMDAVNSAVLTPKESLVKIEPGVSEASLLFLWQARAKISEINGMTSILDKIYLAYNSKLKEVDEARTTGTKESIEILKKDLTIKQKVTENIDINTDQLSVYEILCRLGNTINKNIVEDVNKLNINNQEKFISFVNKTLDVPQNEIFKTTLKIVIHNIDKDLSRALIKIEQNLGAINELDSIKMLQEIEEKHKSKIDELTEKYESIKKVIDEKSKGFFETIQETMQPYLNNIAETSYKAIDDLVKSDFMEKLIEVALQTAKKSFGIDQIIKCVTNVEYNNPLLNHLDLLQKFSSKHGNEITFKLVDLTNYFVNDVNDKVSIENICDSQNALSTFELLMGLSVNESTHL